MAITSDSVPFNEKTFKEITSCSNDYIGKGGFGEVYGPCVWRDKTCAIKKRLYGKSTEEKNAIEKERTACERWKLLDHRNLITVYEVSFESPALYVVMEFASAGSLKEVLESCTSDLPLEILKDWGKQIAQGMAYLHGKNIVHRDLKSPNIVIMEQDAAVNPHGKTLKITDFDQIREHSHTTVMSGIGTYAWKPPEVFAVDGILFSKASDVWSYGVVLWEILTRKIPHKGYNDTQIINEMLHKQLKLEIQNSSPDIITQILIRCLCYNRSGRPSFDDIHRMLAEPPDDQILKQWAEKENSRLLKTSALLIKDEIKVFETDSASSGGSRRKCRQPEEHENRIRLHYDRLINNLNVPDVVTQMFQSEKLTFVDHEHIRQLYPTPIRASGELLTIVINSPREVYDCFLESLRKTKQHHVYQMLTSDEESVCIGELSLSEEHSHVIRQNYDWLTDTIDPDSGLLGILYSQNVLSRREFNQLNTSGMDQIVKTETLLTIISRKSVEDFKKFIIALNETLQGHIAKRLTETPVGTHLQCDIKMALSTTSADSLEKKIKPKIPPKPKKQQPTSPSSRPVFVKPEPLLEPTNHPSEPNLTEKGQNTTTHEMVLSGIHNGAAVEDPDEKENKPGDKEQKVDDD